MDTRIIEPGHAVADGWVAPIDLGRGRASLIGLIVGGAIPAIPLVWGVMDSSLMVLAIGGAIGMPIGLVLGGIFGPDARTDDRSKVVAVVAKIAVFAVIIGDLVIGGGLTVAMMAGGPMGLFMGVLATVIGLFVLGLPALLLTIPAAIAWVLVMRLVPERLVGDGRRPISRWSRRLPAIGIVAILASLGAVPFALAAVDGRYCPDLRGHEVEAMAWSGDDTRLIVATRDGDWDSDRSVLFEVQPATRAVRVFQDVTGAVDGVVVDPDGTTWWTVEDASGLALWSATPTGAAQAHGHIDTSAIDSEFGVEGMGLWWLDGGLALDGMGLGPLRFDVGPSGPILSEPVVTSDLMYGAPLSASVDGTVIGWLEYGYADEVDTGDVAMVVIERGHRRSIPLPGDAVEGLVSADGKAVLFRTDAGWIATPLRGTASLILLGGEWTRPSLMRDQLAAIRVGFRSGQLCFQTVAPTP